MCRHLAWLGRPRTLRDLVLDPAHGLLVQSYAPRRQRYGLLNADGWGVGFWSADSGDGPGDGPGHRALEVHRWRSDRPLWSDASFASVSGALASGCVVAAVRSATVGMPADETAAAPFLAGGWLVSHNGRVDRSVLPLSRAAESVCDSALLAAYVVEQGLDDAQDLARTVAQVGAADPAARLNLLAADGRRVLATAWGDSLSIIETQDGVAVASEPYDDDPRWVDVPDRSLVEVSPDGITVRPIRPATGATPTLEQPA